MNETELQRLVVRLLGDATSFTDMTHQANRDLGEVTKSAESTSVRLKGFRDSLKGYAGSVLTMITGAVGGIGVVCRLEVVGGEGALVDGHVEGVGHHGGGVDADLVEQRRHPRIVPG